MLHKDDLARVAPMWHDMAVRMKTDPEADRAWGWVLEVRRRPRLLFKVQDNQDLLSFDESGFDTCPPWMLSAVTTNILTLCMDAIFPCEVVEITHGLYL